VRLHAPFFISTVKKNTHNPTVDKSRQNVHKPKSENTLWKTKLQKLDYQAITDFVKKTGRPPFLRKKYNYPHKN